MVTKGFLAYQLSIALSHIFSVIVFITDKTTNLIILNNRLDNNSIISLWIRASNSQVAGVLAFVFV